MLSRIDASKSAHQCEVAECNTKISCLRFIFYGQYWNECPIFLQFPIEVRRVKILMFWRIALRKYVADAITHRNVPTTLRDDKKKWWAPGIIRVSLSDKASDLIAWLLIKTESTSQHTFPLHTPQYGPHSTPSKGN
jgi:hypothetical protein